MPPPGNGSPSQQIDRAAILDAFSRLSTELARIGVVGELCVFGGTAMLLAYAARQSTRDVDAVFRPTEPIRRAALRVAEDCGLPPGWLNDAVKGFLSERHQVTAGNLPQFSNLRLTMPVPEYLLAMKCLAARIGSSEGGVSDVEDIRLLVRELGLRTADSVLAVVAGYYPAERIPVRTQYLVESLFEEET